MMEPTRNFPRTRGFTLVEVIVVMAIIALLAAISAPAVVGAKRRGLLTVSAANVKQMLAAVQLYGADSDDIFAFGLPRFWADKRVLLPPDLQLHGNLAPFVEDQLKVYGCTEEQFRAPADPGPSGVSLFERYSTSYSFRVRAFLEPKPMTFYPDPSGYPLVHEADWFYSGPGLGSKRLVGFIDGHARMSPWFVVADLMEERPLVGSKVVTVFRGNCHLCDDAIHAVKRVAAKRGYAVKIESVDGRLARRIGVSVVPSMMVGDSGHVRTGLSVDDLEALMP